MDTLAESSIWWLLAGGMVVVELLTGTFYLLMLAIGLAAGAIAAHLGLGVPMQLAAAALVGGGAVLLLRLLRGKQVQPADASKNRDVNLDIGESIYVGAWQFDGTATATYRGAKWSVAVRPGVTGSSGNHRIVEVVGNRLIVEKI